MLDLKVRYSAELFAGVEAKLGFIQYAAAAVAQAMECFDENDNLLKVDPDEVDVELLQVAPENARFKSLIIVELAGIDYKTRLDNMVERLKWLQQQLVSALWSVGDNAILSDAVSQELPLCSARFISVKPYEWV